MIPAVQAKVGRSDPPPRERSVGELFGELGSEMGTLVRQEVQLATAEVTQKATFVFRQSMRVVLGVLLAQVSVIAMVGALVMGLAQFVAVWMAALLVGVAVAGLAAMVTSSGVYALRQMDPTPKQTVESIGDNARWAREQVR